MASEAQRLIGISLTKIAQSRTHRGGVSLHKNLLVATVLQKARYIFMEEAYNMVHYQSSPIQMPPVQQQQHQQRHQQEDLVGLTAEEAGIESLPDDQDFLETGCVKCASGQDKENQPPSYHASGELTYLDLDKTPSVLKERSNCLKRRRAVTEWETEEAVQSILPKRRCTDEGDDSVFLDDATLLSDTVSKELEQNQSSSSSSSSLETTQTTTSTTTTTTTTTTNGSGSSMEIDRITSLVSIFSFGMGENKINRSVSAPDLCSSQAKDVADSLKQRPFLAMTV